MAKILTDEVASIGIIRKNGKTTLNLRLAPEIEQLFRNSVGGEKMKVTSKTGPTYEWYPVTRLTNKFSKWAKRGLLNNPESGLDQDKTFNFSFLFAAGTGSDKGASLDFEDLYSKELLEEYGKQLNAIVREIYNEYVSDMTLEHTMTMKVVSA